MPYLQPAPSLPWYRSTVFLILGGLAMLVLGGVAGAAVTFVGVNAAGILEGEFGSAEVVTYGRDGDLATFALGAGQCAAQDLFEVHAFEEGTNVPCEAVVPSADAWDEGTRTVHCVLFEYDGGSSTGSAHGSRR